ncbi:MAG: EAL domain-containing protein [Gammaproteobacteria bacterium]|nr:EAL domain-containing protein [Gammaproteobacteria bacterium]MBQ0840311.1 EAL domain-containing protein [Gammaproteobacteria bacterium]
MAKEGILNLLVAHDKSDDASRLISLLEGASYQVDAQVLTSAEELAPLLQSRQWDLAIGHLQATSLPAKKLMAGIRSLGSDIPAILISKNSDIVDVVEGIRMGASYVIPEDEDQYFLLATSSTLEQLEQRRVQLDWKQRYNAAETRCETLMDSSKNAIALVQDGTYIYINEPFSQLMGYSDPDDMLMAPVIDSIDPGCQEKIKPFLKPLDAEAEISDTAIDLTCLTTEDQAIDLRVSICQIQYQGEAALQFQVKYEAGINDAGPIEISGEAAPRDGSFAINPQATLDNINLAINSAQLSGGLDSIILCVQADQDAQIRSNTSESNADKILLALAKFIVAQSEQGIVFSRDRQDAINLVIADSTLEEGRQFAETLCRQVAENNFLVGSQSILLSISASIGLITKNTASAEICIEQCLKTLDDADPDSASDGEKVYLMNALSQTDFNIHCDEKITLFGQQLLEKRLIGIAFQPIVGLNDENAEFYEVLMRPKIEEYPENIPPDFIGKVFESPIATEIDRWVILETIKMLADKHSSAPQTCLFINLSAATIQDEKFSPWLKLALKTSQTPPATITLQLSENDAGRYIEQSQTLISQLRAIGCKVALTHFGLSSNPLLVLDKLSADFVKLDKQFIENIRAGGEEEEEAQQLIILLKEMEQHCIAPFIESPTLIPTLWQNGIEYIQGHYIQAPSSEMDYSFNEED